MPLRKAVLVDQYELFRLGIERVLDDLNIHVTTSTQYAGAGLRAAKEGDVDFLIVGRHSDLKHQRALREAKKQKSSLLVLMLLDRAEKADVARLISLGADGLLLRTAKAEELGDAIERIQEGERVVAPAVAAGTLGRVGPAMDVSAEEAQDRSGLTRKEQEVLAILAEGATYKEIAESLIVTQATVKSHLVHIYAKLGVKNREQAVARALALGLLG